MKNKHYLVNEVIDGIKVEVYFDDVVYSEDEKKDLIARFLIALTNNDTVSSKTA